MPNVRLPLITLIVLACLALPGLALADDPVVLISDDRAASNIGQSCWEDFELGYTCDDAYSYHYAPPSPFAAWGDSQVTPLEMSDTGWGSAYSDYGWYEQNESFDVTFDVVSPVAIEFSGVLEAGGGWGGGEAVAQLKKGDDTIFYASAYDSYEEFLFMDVLLPGRYRVIVRTLAYPISEASYSFSLVMEPTVVPEPASALLVGLGLFVTARSARRR